MTKVAWIGLGVMGYPMAGHLAKAGHDVTVFNRSSGKAKAWTEAFGGTSADTPAAAAEGAEIVFSCVGADDDLRSVTKAQEGAFHAMAPGSYYVDCTTTSADVAKELAEVLSQKSCHFLDAPVSGGQAGAENGQLTVMVGGDPAAFDHVSPVIDAFARKVTRIGTVSAGQTAKMVNQLCIAGVVQGLAEGMALAKNANLDIQAVMETIAEGAAGSWQMSNRWKTMDAGKYDFGFAVDWMRKDLGIALKEVARLGGTAPVGALVDQFYGDVQRTEGGKWDTSSLLTRLR
ncbi:NAD(P)-dependent oxidoreductase [uncultured Roseobacter sp.]|uniref:NAD(P)-dependent oxidoreductase n=1 Tax=uncultured Roseobacter sp. TaxID=114847 RepID=UPI002614244A|nr:NAD(P)-dependent oxidoreductase [uncultured Roseobacter sp.]